MAIKKKGSTILQKRKEVYCPSTLAKNTETCWKWEGLSQADCCFFYLFTSVQILCRWQHKKEKLLMSLT